MRKNNTRNRSKQKKHNQGYCESMTKPNNALFSTRTLPDGRIVANVSYDERYKAKAAGFHWDPIQKYWFKYESYVAEMNEIRERRLERPWIEDRPQKYLSRRGWKTR